MPYITESEYSKLVNAYNKQSDAQRVIDSLKCELEAQVKACKSVVNHMGDDDLVSVARGEMATECYKNVLVYLNTLIKKMN